MQFIAIKSPILHMPQQNIFPILDQICPPLKNKDLLFITAKILSLHQGRCILMDFPTGEAYKRKKKSLIQEEADYLYWNKQYDYPVSIKNRTLVGSAGIDESNGNGYWILWPTQIDQLLQDIRTYLIQKHAISDLGVIATDSHITPLRQGMLGTVIGKVGVSSLKDYRGKNDIFGKPLMVTQSNVLESLVGTVVLYMGEGSEQVPFVLVRDSKHGKFVNILQFDGAIDSEDHFVSLEEDVYSKLYVPFKKNKSFK